MSAYGPKRTCRKTQSMSLLGVKRTCRLQCEMSAFDPKRTFVALFSEVGRLDTMACPEPRGDDEAARIHHAYWRRGGVAAYGVRAAAGSDAANWRTHVLCRGRPASKVPPRSLRRRVTATGLDRRP